ncbi:MAG: SAM-dependent methyltransferase, partial [Clostridia bacterium]|nr:SAM-dependent methyltransferase [Clostridia bacterium]
MKIAKWNDYKIIMTSQGEKLEQWAGYYLLRPDPQIIWNN